MRYRAFSTAMFAAFVLGVAVRDARAADLPLPEPVYAPPQECCGWYLRGDIGMTNQRVKSADNMLMAGAANYVWLDPISFDSGMLFGIGAGYYFNNWLRVDVTGEYRGKAALHGLDSYLDGVTTRTNDYTGNKSEWLFLANAYVDLGTWWCITPFIGAGVGVAHVSFNNFRDVDVIGGSGGYADSASKVNFAWALHAGLGYQITRNLTAEFAYRYVSLGDGATGDVINFGGGNLYDNPWTFKSVTSHDLKFGLRWTCCDVPAPQPVTYAPLVTKG